tara:strand:- start:236 stop:1267 length:1032 start_codon:yes stop_codon:yes gene_type:complete
MKNCVSFDDVLLVPKFSEVISRKEISLESSLNPKPSHKENLVFELPIISSPMDTVTEDAMACAMHNAGGLGIIHRYNSVRDQALLVRSCEGANVGATIGVSGDYLERAKALLDNGANVLCIDIAHGHHTLMRHALETLRNTFGWDVHIMAGNVATRSGYEDLARWGASSVRVGIGGGSICSTRIQTGHGMPTLQSVIDCSYSELAGEIPIIADGGIKNSGDIVKAIGAGADFVMLGSLLAGTSESPGHVYSENGEQSKVYRGMASKDAQISWRGHTSSVEGVTSTIPFKGSVEEILAELCTGIRSGLSYSGCFDIGEFQASSEFVRQSVAGATESSTHILTRG